MVLAADPQAAAGQAVEVLHAQHAVVVEGVDLAVDDVGGATVDADGGAVHDQAFHAATADGGAGGIALEHAGLAQGGLGEAQQAPGHLDHFRGSVASGHLNLLVQRDRHFVVVKRGAAVPSGQHADQLGV
ncbi:hypothetical protein D3C78_1579560 [compost metagenome]